MKQKRSSKLAFIASIAATSLYIGACASTAPQGAASNAVAQNEEVVVVNANGEPVEMTEAQRAAVIEANRKVRDCRKRQRSTGSRIAREACGNVTSIFGTGIHVRNENNVRVGAGQETPIPQ